MGQYIVKYRDNDQPLADVVGAMLTGGLTMLMDDPGTQYHCEITDTETGLVGATSEWMPSKTKAHDAAWHDLMDKRQEHNERQQELEREYIHDQQSIDAGSRLAALLIKGLIYVFVILAIIWVAFNVVLPLLLIDIALISLIIGLVNSKYKIYLFVLSIIGAIYILMDYNSRWLTDRLIYNVPFLKGSIPFFCT